MDCIFCKIIKGDIPSYTIYEDDIVKVFLDVSMKRFSTVFPACGSSNSAIELTCDEMEKYSHCEKWVDVCKAYDDTLSE